MKANLADAILSIFTATDLFQMDATGEKFQAVTETDLMSRLRDKGRRLPAAGWFAGDVRRAGFQVRQGYQFDGKVRRAFEDGSTGRAVSNYQTLIFI